MADTKNRERTPLNEYTVKVINGTRYKVRCIYVGDKDFKKLFEDLIVKGNTTAKPTLRWYGECGIIKIS